MSKFTDRLSHAWNAFIGKPIDYSSIGRSSYFEHNPNSYHMTVENTKSIIMAVYNRIAVDVSAIKIEHVRVDQNGGYVETIKSGLNDCLTLSANKDQTGRAFVYDIVMMMLNEGCAAIVPIDTNIDPNLSSSYNIKTMRVGKIKDWYPDHVKIELYNDRVGRKEEILIPKGLVAIVTNPFYVVMNEPNSTAKRLIRKLNLLDVIDEQSGSGKLDLIIKLPYLVKTDARRKQAEERKKEIENQLANSKYGIAYVDGTEEITQLNRSLENNLLNQIKYLTSMLYSQLGMPESVFEGTADEQTMINYSVRTIEPIISAIVDSLKKTFLTSTAISQNQSIEFFINPFKLVPVSKLSDIADKFTRNEILSSNEFRQIIGYKPSDDPRANELRNKNISQPIESERTIVDEETDEV